MATKSITASAQTMRKKKEQLISYNKEYKSALTAMKNQEEILVKEWKGEASTAFNSTFATDHANLLSFSEVITEYANTLENIIAAYEKTEAKNAGLFGSK